MFIYIDYHKKKVMLKSLSIVVFKTNNKKYIESENFQNCSMKSSFPFLVQSNHCAFSTDVTMI